MMIATGTAAQLRRTYGIQPQQLGHWRRSGKAELLSETAPKIWRVHIEPPNSIGAMLAEYRRRAGISQSELADAVGWHQQTIARYETDAVELNEMRLRHLLAVLGAPLERFLAELESAPAVQEDA
jgi:DNA-binding XRE family transcriptional regulator